MREGRVKLERKWKWKWKCADCEVFTSYHAIIVALSPLLVFFLEFFVVVFLILYYVDLWFLKLQLTFQIWVLNHTAVPDVCLVRVCRGSEEDWSDFRGRKSCGDYRVFLGSGRALIPPTTGSVVDTAGLFRFSYKWGTVASVLSRVFSATGADSCKLWLIVWNTSMRIERTDYALRVLKNCDKMEMGKIRNVNKA